MPRFPLTAVYPMSLLFGLALKHPDWSSIVKLWLEHCNCTVNSNYNLSFRKYVIRVMLMLIFRLVHLFYSRPSTGCAQFIACLLLLHVGVSEVFLINFAFIYTYYILLIITYDTYLYFNTLVKYLNINISLFMLYYIWLGDLLYFTFCCFNIFRLQGVLISNW